MGKIFHITDSNCSSNRQCFPPSIARSCGDPTIVTAPKSPGCVTRSTGSPNSKTLSEFFERLRKTQDKRLLVPSVFTFIIIIIISELSVAMALGRLLSSSTCMTPGSSGRNFQHCPSWIPLRNQRRKKAWGAVDNFPNAMENYRASASPFNPHPSSLHFPATLPPLH